MAAETVSRSSPGAGCRRRRASVRGGKALFENQGIECRTFADGPSALAAIREFHPRVVVLDDDVPGMNGYEVVAALRAEGSRVKVLLLTADAQRKRAERTISGEAFQSRGVGGAGEEVAVKGGWATRPAEYSYGLKTSRVAVPPIRISEMIALPASVVYRTEVAVNFSVSGFDLHGGVDDGAAADECDLFRAEADAIFARLSVRFPSPRKAARD